MWRFCPCPTNVVKCPTVSCSSTVNLTIPVTKTTAWGPGADIPIHFTISLVTSSFVIPVSNNPGISIANMRLPNLTALSFYISVLRKTHQISIWNLHSREWSFLLSCFRPQSFLSKRFLIRLRHPLPVENICYDVKGDLFYTFVNKDSTWKPSPNKNYSILCLYLLLNIKHQSIKCNMCCVWIYQMEWLWFPQCFCTGLT